MGVPVVMGEGAKRGDNKFVLQEAKDGEKVSLGSVKLQIIHTPGHTLESSCFLLFDANQVPIAMFTGDTVLIGEIGHPDLAGNPSISKHDLAGMLYESLQKLKGYDDDIRVYPAHGTSHSCGKAIGGGGNYCTLGQQKADNHGFQQENKEKFIAEAAINPAPSKYFFYDSFLNQQGPPDYTEVAKRVHVPLSVEEYKVLA